MCDAAGRVRIQHVAPTWHGGQSIDRDNGVAASSLPSRIATETTATNQSSRQMPMVRVARVIEFISRVRNHIFQYEIQRSEFYTAQKSQKV